MRTLKNGNCLNDEVVNVFMKSLAATNKKSVEDGMMGCRLNFSSVWFLCPLLLAIN